MGCLSFKRHCLSKSLDWNLVDWIKSQVKEIAIVGGISVLDHRNNVNMQPEMLLEKRKVRLSENEPVTHIYECEGA